ncbi:MAG: thiamine pyrophosphate-binding protein [Thermoanaerobaculia bacterium]|nr:thiamine pyrophosphate-binding protein [Thermoanaerobaculia bacterium]
MRGGDLVGEVLHAQRVDHLFTLCGGHISPILVAAKRLGIRVVDTRHEATAVFAADAMARLTGRPGVAAVTAGPGVTNTMTAVKNAQMAQSPVVLIGGAAPTVLRGRGALQDIDQMSLVRPVVKWAARVSRVRELVPALERAFREAQSGVPGPVFVEIPVDLLYDEETVRKWYGMKSQGRSLADKAVAWYLERHLDRAFSGAGDAAAGAKIAVAPEMPGANQLADVATRLERCERPVLVIGSQATLRADEISRLADAVTALGIPAYLSGMARGLLGRGHPLQMRHKRQVALKEADLVVLAGVPCDFRLDYGRHIRRGATLVSANLSRTDLNRNRRPSVGVLADPGTFLVGLSERVRAADRWTAWRETLRERDNAREVEIDAGAGQPGEAVNPIALLREVDRQLAPGAIVVGDGGDFVATAAYTVSPTGPLTWLDPGAFGTLGVGAGFALGAKLARPDAAVWVLFGDGAAGYSVVEFDTFVRHGLGVIAVIGNDASWAQIARDQVEILGDDVGTVLARTDYHRVAEGFGAAGLEIRTTAEVATVLGRAREIAASGRPVLVNAMLSASDFRKGSISM